MENFIFGTLSTLDLRVQRTLSMRSGIHHGNRLEPQAPQAGDTPLLTVLVKRKSGIASLHCELSAPDSAEIPLQLVRTEWDLLDWQYVQVWQCRLPVQQDGALVRYAINGVTLEGVSISAEKASFAYYVGSPATPEWSRSAVIYQLFPDRFASDPDTMLPDFDDPNEIFGGTLAGILDKLDYIVELGFNAIWLNPIFPDHTHHGYHATDYFTVNPRLGTMAQVRQLVAECHKRDIRLILDFVANHWGSNHPTFVDAQSNATSPYRSWYLWTDWPTDYKTFFGVKDLPQLNVDNPEVQAHLLDSAEFWLGDVGFDGLRLDYAVGPSHAFWAALRQRVKAVKPDAWMFGEVVEDPGSQLSYYGRLDGCIDFMLAQALRATFAIGSMSLPEFDHFLQQHASFAPNDYSQPSFFDNHDMDRLLLLADGDVRKLKLAALCLLTLPGAPVVYYGTEVGVSQRHPMHEGGGWGMAEARRPMRWGAAQDADLHRYFAELIAFRRAQPVIWNGTRETLHVDAETQTYVYRYTGDSAETPVTIAFNLSDDSQSISLSTNTIVLEPLSGTYSAAV